MRPLYKVVYIYIYIYIYKARDGPQSHIFGLSGIHNPTPYLFPCLGGAHQACLQGRFLDVFPGHLNLTKLAQMKGNACLGCKKRPCLGSKTDNVLVLTEMRNVNALVLEKHNVAFLQHTISYVDEHAMSKSCKHAMSHSHKISISNCHEISTCAHNLEHHLALVS